MSLHLVIASLQTGTYVVSRPGADTYAAGIRTPGTPSTFNVDASVQPLTARLLRAMPEGRRAEDTRILWTRTVELLVGDRITIGGEAYEVFRVDAHGVLGSPFYRAWAARQIVGVA